MRHKVVVVNIKIMKYVSTINTQNQFSRDCVMVLHLNGWIEINIVLFFLMMNPECDKIVT